MNNDERNRCVYTHWKVFRSFEASFPGNFSLTDRRATVPPIVKTVCLLRRKSCARLGLNFSIFLQFQVKIPDEKNTRHVYLYNWGKI